MKDEYIKLLSKILDDIDKIDNNTHWYEIEPKWWLDMMDLDKIVKNKIDNIK